MEMLAHRYRTSQDIIERKIALGHLFLRLSCYLLRVIRNKKLALERLKVVVDIGILGNSSMRDYVYAR